MTTDITPNTIMNHHRLPEHISGMLIGIIMVISILIARPVSASGSEIRTGRFFTDKSISTVNFNDICMDSDGIIWIGTTNGLVRFDGKNYDLYRHDEKDNGSISDNRILKIITDSKGRTWIGTANGLNLYDQETDKFTTFELPTGNFSNGYIIDITEQSDGTVTFIASGIGLFIVDDSKETPVMVRYLTLLHGDKECISLANSSKRLYIGSHNGDVISVAQNNQVNTIAHLPSYADHLSVETDSTLIAATSSEVYRINTDSHEMTRIDMPTCSQILSLKYVGKGKTFIGTGCDGIVELQVGQRKAKRNTDIFSSEFDVTKAQVGDIYLSPKGDLWIGCNRHGIMNVHSTPLPFRYVPVREILQDYDGTVGSMACWKGNLITGLDNGKVIMTDPNSRLLMQARIPDGGCITSVKTQGDEVLLGVVGSGVWSLDPKSGAVAKLYEIPGGYPTILAGPTYGGKLYVSLHGEGVMAIDRKTGEREWIDRKKNGTHVGNGYGNVLTADGDWLWIGHYDGIDRYNMKTGKLDESVAQRLPGISTFAICPVGDGTMLVGTSSGLMHYNPTSDTYKKYTNAEGLSDNHVKGITRDNQGRYWIATTRGISRWNTNGHIDTYLGGYGIAETEFNHIAFSGKTTMYTGNSIGITTFDTDKVPNPGFKTAPMISAITLNGRRIVYGKEIGKEPVIEIPENVEEGVIKIHLPYKQNSIVARLSMLEYRDESNIAYYWRLDKDKEWNQLGRGEDLLYLTHLDPGTHHLQIKAEENNVFSPEREFIISVSSPWYLTPLAKIIFAAILVTLAALAWINTKRKRQAKINDAKIKYFMDVSHDIRSPITLILDPIQHILEKTEDTDTRRQLKTMQRNANRILSLVNQMLDIRKIEKGRMHLACRKTNLPEFASQLVDMFQEQAGYRNQTLLFEQNSDIPEMWLDRDNFDKILVNLISNAIKYTPAGGEIVLSVGVVNDQALGKCAEVSVTDTGIGLDSDAEKHLFDRFYRDRGNHTSGTEGFGIGLDLCRRLVLLHHGRISGCNRKDGVKGSVFTVLLPLSESVYPASERIEKKPNVQEETVRHLHRAELAANDASDKEDTCRKKRSLDRTILIADDDSEIRQYIAGQLSQSFKVLQASNGIEALKIISTAEIDLLVSDIVMPEKDGLSLLKQIKTGSSTAHIPVILLSSKSDVSDRLEGWEKGADGYMGKPFSMQELEAMIENLLHNRLRMKGKYSGAREAADKIETPKLKGVDEVLLEKIVKAIEDNIDSTSFNVERLASDVGLSRAHLNRRMKDMMGMTPADYIRNVKLRRACELLKTSDIEVTQLAYTIGFTSQSHFSSSFKKYTGYSPSEYREKHLAGELEENQAQQ